MAKSPSVRMTVAEAAAKWGRSPSLVHKWVRQHRVKFERIGNADRAAAILITQAEPPELNVKLTPEQRAAWPVSVPSARKKAAGAPRRRAKRPAAPPAAP